jgi:hypothetical protein
MAPAVDVLNTRPLVTSDSQHFGIGFEADTPKISKAAPLELREDM